MTKKEINSENWNGAHGFYQSDDYNNFKEDEKLVQEFNIKVQLLVNSQRDMSPECTKLIDDNFWELTTD